MRILKNKRLLRSYWNVKGLAKITKDKVIVTALRHVVTKKKKLKKKITFRKFKFFIF